MVKLLRCKACGFIIAEDKLGDKCPACGVPRKSFEEYSEKVNARRNKLIRMDLHPVIVHFPQAFAMFLLLLLGLILITKDNLHTQIINTVQIMSFFMPFFLVAAVLSGMFDGKLRFKKITTPILIKKIIFGSTFLGLGIAIAIIGSMWAKIPSVEFILIVLCMGCVICEGILGKLGASLLEAKLPG